MSAAKQDSKAVLYFSYEMLYGEVSLRLLGAEAKIDRRKMKSKEFTPEELKSISEAVQTLSSLNLFLEDNGGVDLDEIRNQCMNIKAEKGLSMVLIDYLQLMPPCKNMKTRAEEIEWIIHALKELAIELEVPVVLLSQIMRSKDQITNRPQLNDLRMADPILNLADVVCFIHRDDYYDPNTEKKGIAEIIVPKNRVRFQKKIEMNSMPL